MQRHTRTAQAHCVTTACALHDRGVRVQERKKLLSFVIVGGGPTGVEVAAEMYDMMTQDMKLLYPDIMSDVKIRVVELMDYVLSSYDRKLGEYTAELFKRNGVELVRPLANTSFVSQNYEQKQSYKRIPQEEEMRRFVLRRSSLTRRAAAAGRCMTPCICAL